MMEKYIKNHLEYRWWEKVLKPTRKSKTETSMIQMPRTSEAVSSVGEVRIMVLRPLHVIMIDFVKRISSSLLRYIIILVPMVQTSKFYVHR